MLSMTQKFVQESFKDELLAFSRVFETRNLFIGKGIFDSVAGGMATVNFENERDLTPFLRNLTMSNSYMVPDLRSPSHIRINKPPLLSFTPKSNSTLAVAPMLSATSVAQGFPQDKGGNNNNYNEGNNN